MNHYMNIFQKNLESVSEKQHLTDDSHFFPISCLGDCDHAPAMMINNDHFNNLTIEKIDEILKNINNQIWKVL